MGIVVVVNIIWFVIMFLVLYNMYCTGEPLTARDIWALMYGTLMIEAAVIGG